MRDFRQLLLFLFFVFYLPPIAVIVWLYLNDVDRNDVFWGSLQRLLPVFFMRKMTIGFGRDLNFHRDLNLLPAVIGSNAPLRPQAQDKWPSQKGSNPQ